MLSRRGSRVGASESFELFASLPPEAAAPEPRIGLAFSRKSAKWAVARNLARRLVRESARGFVDLPVYDYVVRGRAGLGMRWLEAKRAKALGELRRRWRLELDELFARVQPRA